MTTLKWHNYKYLPYEKMLAIKEVKKITGLDEVLETSSGVDFGGDFDRELGKRLTYFSSVEDEFGSLQTDQAFLEWAEKGTVKRQSTRYSVHGLHDYKGKFNPQVVRSLLNIFGASGEDRVLDPFCGSGTTLVECAHMGLSAYGTDINPLAVFVANSKLLALQTDPDFFETKLNILRARLTETSLEISEPESPRQVYLASWFEPLIHQKIETVRRVIGRHCGKCTPVFLCIASDLLRDYSNQDPGDLRIRRRKSPLPDTEFETAFVKRCERILSSLKATYSILGKYEVGGSAHLTSINDYQPKADSAKFDFAITSPPYAMALPYIDTQRLSLIWLDMLPPNEVLKLESELIGSREFKVAKRREIFQKMEFNSSGLPEEEINFCRNLQSLLTETDGFRRQAVPTLLYRYFSEMLKSFRKVKEVVKPGGRYALIVGHNHTVLGGEKQDINTPVHLANLAKSVGWQVEEMMPMETYRRFGLHAGNSVASETLIFLQNPLE